MKKWGLVEKACNRWFVAWESGDVVGMDAALMEMEKLDEEKK